MTYKKDEYDLWIPIDGGGEIRFHMPDGRVEGIELGLVVMSENINDDDLNLVYVKVNGKEHSLFSMIDVAERVWAKLSEEERAEARAQTALEEEISDVWRYV